MRIENLDEQRKTWAVRKFTEDFLSVLAPQFVQTFSAQRPTRHDALRFGAIDDFPRLADALLRRKLFLKFGFEPSPAPHSLDENWFEGKGSGDFVPRHGPANVQCPTRLRKAMAWQASNIQQSIQDCVAPRRHWTFSVGCWMFGVSVLMTHFRHSISK